MQQEQLRQIVSSTMQKSLSESGVVISAIPGVQLQALTNALADGVFAAFAAIEAENDAPSLRAASANLGQAVNQSSNPGYSASAASTAPSEEQMVWRGRPYLTIGTIYELTSQRLRIIRGILGTQIEEIELFRIRDSKVKQHVGERILNVGDITVISADSTLPEVVLHNVQDPIAVRELLRKTVQTERQRRGLVYREVLEDSDHGDHH